MAENNFKERVRKAAIDGARIYQEIFLNYEYLICSEAFNIEKYYIIDGQKDNYQHLVGINPLIDKEEFFIKSKSGELTLDDFNFDKDGASEKSTKGTVRRKIIALPSIGNLFTKDTMVQERFIKNTNFCHFATSDNKCTLGFVSTPKSRPKTLLKGNELKKDKMKKVDLIIRKKKDEKKFNEIIVGDINILMKHFNDIKELIDDSLITLSKSYIQKEVASEGIENDDK